MAKHLNKLDGATNVRWTIGMDEWNDYLKETRVQKQMKSWSSGHKWLKYLAQMVC